MKLLREVIQFFQGQGFVIVSTVDSGGTAHSSCKGIVGADKDGTIYLLDLYRGKTFDNLKARRQISITAVDEHRFTGYCLKGWAEIITGDKIKPRLLQAWEDRIAARLTQRVIKNMRQEKGHLHHPEILLPQPEYLIMMKVKEVIDLTPRHIKQKG